jgi:hypothetical protein
MHSTSALDLIIRLTGVKEKRGAHLSYISLARGRRFHFLSFFPTPHTRSPPPLLQRRPLHAAALRRHRRSVPAPRSVTTRVSRRPRIASPPPTCDHAAPTTCALAAASAIPRHRPRATLQLAHCLHADAHASSPLALPVLHSRIHTVHANCSKICPSRFLHCFHAAFAFPHSHATI